jgi:2-polyprenyl-3-methyl-5-hydroxy-6-metoxy-1,4-benzoquinol methylase
MANPCAFSPRPRDARRLAGFYAQMFSRGPVLDLGFGQGYFLEAARERGLRLIGIERDQSLVEQARARGYDARCADVRQLGDVVSERVDGALATHLIEHLHPDAVASLLATLAERMQPGSPLVLATPNFADWRVASQWFWYDPTHVRPYAAPTVSQLASAQDWLFDAEGWEPTFFSRESFYVWLKRIRYGRDYGRPGRWFRLIRR